MPLTSTNVVLDYHDVVANVPIVVPLPAFSASEVYVRYGEGKAFAVHGPDYVLELDYPEPQPPPTTQYYQTVTITPTTALLSKIALDGTNVIYVGRELPLTTDFSETDAFTRSKIDVEFARTNMKLQQIDAANVTSTVPDPRDGEVYDLIRVNADRSGYEFFAATGGGDMFRANNLSDVVDPAASLVNIGGQAVNAKLTGITNLNTVPGFMIHDGSNAYIKRTLQAGAGVSITNSDGISGDPVIAMTGGAGDVVGPASATDGNPAVYNGATGKLIKEVTFASFKVSLGLNNVDNTSDASKPVSIAQQAALDLKAPLASPPLTGVPTAPTATAGTNTTQLATTAFVQSAITAGGGYTDEQAQDAIGTILVDSATIDFTYDDTTPSITAIVINDAVTNAKLANMTAPAIKARGTAGTGDPEDIAIGAGLVLDATSLRLDVGKQSIWIPAESWIANTTNGPSAGSAEMATNKNMVVSKDFDATTIESVQKNIVLPKSWNRGTVTYQVYWSHAATTVNFGVMWGLSGYAISDTDALDQVFPANVTVTDTGGTTNVNYISAESGAVTIGGTPAIADLINLRLQRVANDAADTMAIDARFAGVMLFYTASTLKDN